MCSVKNFFFYLMWDVTKHPPMYTQRLRSVLRDCGIKQTNTPYGAKQTPTPESRIDFNTIYNNPHLTM